MRNLQKLDLAGLSVIDGGRLAVAFEQALRRCISDCDDRPGEKKPRTITVKLDVTPVIDERNMCEDCNVQVSIDDSVPKRKSKPYNCSLGKTSSGPILSFHEESLEDHLQEALDFEGGEH